MRSGSGFRKTLAVIEGTGKWILIFVFCLMILDVSVQVLNRHFVKELGLTAWTEETALFLLVWTTFMAAIWVTKDDEHIGMRLLIERLPHRGQLVANLIVDLISMAFLAVVIWQGVAVMEDNVRVTTPMLQLSRSLFYLALFLASIFMLLLTGAHFVKTSRAFRQE